MKTISATFELKLRNIEAEVDDNASVADCHTALLKKAKKVLLFEENWVEYLKCSEKELCPTENSFPGFDLLRGRAEKEIKRIK